MNIYQQEILDHYDHPIHKGKPADFTHSCKLQNLSCGDEVEVFLTIKNQKIEKINFEGEGCVISLASCDIHAQTLEGKSTEEISKLTWEDSVKFVGVELTSSRIKCAHMVLEAIQKAVKEL